jgi:hypothetical protein
VRDTLHAILFLGKLMGCFSDETASDCGITREEQDECKETQMYAFGLLQVALHKQNTNYLYNSCPCPLQMFPRTLPDRSYQMPLYRCSAR